MGYPRVERRRVLAAAALGREEAFPAPIPATGARCGRSPARCWTSART
ncbi:hypothetical protein ACFQYP_50140 [Nonomuraea antimicrobica]